MQKSQTFNNLIIVLSFVVKKSNVLCYTFYDMRILLLCIPTETGGQHKMLDFVIFIK